MKKLLLAFIVVTLLPTFVAAEQFNRQPKKPKQSSMLRPNKECPCAQYGAGFVRVGSTTTCMKIGGGVTFGGGGRR